MTDFSNGKIYKLVSTKTDDVYIGSCVIKLSARLSIHRHISNKCVSKKMFADNAIITICLIESYPCKSKNELKARELFYITSMKCININKPFITDLKYTDEGYYALYREERADEIKAYQSAYKLEHIDEIKAYQSAYNLEHIDEIKASNLAFNTANPTYHSEYQKRHPITPEKRKQYNAKAYAKLKEAKRLALINTVVVEPV